MNAGRRYSSPLRAEQAATTHRRILDAAIALLQETDSGHIAIPDVAERAGVSVSTAYRAFPTRDDLLEGVLEELSQRFESVAGPLPTTLDDLVDSARRAVRAVHEVEPLYRALFATPEGRELHRRTAPRRTASLDAMLSNELANLTDDERRTFIAVAHLLSSSRSVLFLKDYQGLDAEQSVAAVHWALDVLVTAVRDPQQRARMQVPTEEAES
jgi:AcrR family transcriptional regulator